MTTKVFDTEPQLNVCCTACVVPVAADDRVMVGPSRNVGLYVANADVGVEIVQLASDAPVGTAVTKMFCGLPPMLMNGLLNVTPVSAGGVVVLDVVPTLWAPAAEHSNKLLSSPTVSGFMVYEDMFGHLSFVVGRCG